MPQRAKGLLAVVLAAAAVGLGCQDLRAYRAKSRYPRVVLVSLDTLHYRHVNPYNPEVDHTPYLARFAEEGVRVEYAYTHTPITLPSHASLLTGMSPPSLGVMANGDTLSDDAVTLTETLREAGYRTAAFFSLGVLQEPYGLSQGFELYHDPFAEGAVRWYRRAHEIFAPIASWIEEHQEEPFFLWVHFSDPHEPYVTVDYEADTELFLDGESLGRFALAGVEHQEARFTLGPGRHRLEWRSLWEARPDDRPETGIDLTMLSVEGVKLAQDELPELPAPLRPDRAIELHHEGEDDASVRVVFAGRLNRPPPSFVLPNYDRNVRQADAHLKQLDEVLSSLGLMEDTLMVVVSDHGEGLYAHGILGHASHVYEDQLRIIWMMKGGDLPRGRVVEDRPALMTDVAPTVLDLLGLPDDGMEGRSFQSCFTGGECPEALPWWSYGLNHSTRGLTGMAAYRWPYKWIWRRSFRRIAFDAEKDPTEENDLLANPGPHNPEPLKRAAESFRAERRRLARALSESDDTGVGLDDERERLLKSLGYLGDDDPPHEDDAEGGEEDDSDLPPSRR